MFDGNWMKQTRAKRTLTTSWAIETKREGSGGVGSKMDVIVEAEVEEVEEEDGVEEEMTTATWKTTDPKLRMAVEEATAMVVEVALG